MKAIFSEAQFNPKIEQQLAAEAGVTVISNLYNDPAVWKKLGFEGSSAEFGGYLSRGFDDIAWLPKS